MKHLTDQELMKIVQAGDFSPAAEIYDRYSTRIYSFAWKLLRDHELASDATQEVFLRMLKKANTFKEDSSVSTWLYAITVNWCRDHFRRRENQVPKETEDVLRSLPTAAEYDPGYRFEQKSGRQESARIVEDALARLTPEQREAVILSRYHDVSNADIAKIVGCSEGAAKTRIFRGLDAMRRYLVNRQQDQQSATEVTPAETPVEETNV